MGMLLILFTLYFGVVVFWAAPRLYRQLQARNRPRQRLASCGAADRIDGIKPVRPRFARDTGNRGMSC